MEQNTVVRNLSHWLSANKWHQSLTVLYDLGSYGQAGESQKSGLYLGEKRRSKGRLAQVAQPDILVRREDTRTIELIVEVDFRQDRKGQWVAPRPKDLVGLLLTPAAADNHTPSYEYEKSYELRDTVIMVVAAYPTCSQRDLDQDFAETLFRRFHVAERGVREFCVCGGASADETEAMFSDLIRNRFITSQTVAQVCCAPH